MPPLLLRGATLVWWQLKNLLEPLWLWPRFLEVFNEEYFFETIRDQKTIEFLNLEQENMTVVEYNAKFMELSRYVPHIVSSESHKTRKFEATLSVSVTLLLACFVFKRNETSSPLLVWALT